jgi:hypothetical protein
MSTICTAPTRTVLQSQASLDYLLSKYEQDPSSIEDHASHLFQEGQPTQNQTFTNGCLKVTPQWGSCKNDSVFSLRTNIPATVIKADGVFFGWYSKADFVQNARQASTYHDLVSGITTDVLEVQGGCYVSEDKRRGPGSTPMLKMAAGVMKDLLGDSVTKEFESVITGCKFHKVKGQVDDMMDLSDEDEDGGVELEQDQEAGDHVR